MATAQGLPIGFADQVLDLEIRLEDEESLEVIQILSQMYRVSSQIFRLPWNTSSKTTSKGPTIFKKSLIT